MFRFLIFCQENREMDPHVENCPFLKIAIFKKWQFSMWEVRFDPLPVKIFKIGLQIRVLHPKKPLDRVLLKSKQFLKMAVFAVGGPI